VLYYFFYNFSEYNSVFNVFRYITFRTLLAGLSSFLICILVGPWFIRKMTSKQIGQYIREDGPSSHLSKKGTPTMGGGLILFSIIISTILWSDLSNVYIWLMIFIISFFGIIGWLDDFLKISGKNSKGLSSKHKIILQALGAIIFSVLLDKFTEQDYILRLPVFKNLEFNLSYFFYFLAIFVIVATSNSVNLTDGLDGLAIGPVMTSAFTFLILSYAAGNYIIAQYLQITFVKGTGELSIFAASILMSGLGFLWFNSYPAQVFMGDVGSLSLGSALGALAIITKNEILLVVIGGVFVLEAISVILQVASFKLTGKRTFRMAPVHHHFELKGWAEPKVIVRFWIISILLAIIALSTLKLR